jgi:hypothetical protein
VANFTRAGACAQVSAAIENIAATPITTGAIAEKRINFIQ